METAVQSPQDMARENETLKAENAKLRDEIEQLRQRVDWLVRMQFGQKSDKRSKKPAYDGPGLFDDEIEEAVKESKEAAEAAAEQIQKRDESRQRKPRPSRKGKNLLKYGSVPEKWQTIYPDGIDISDYEVIGHDVVKALRRKPAEVWLECIDYPKIIRKDEMGREGATVLQAPKAPTAVSGTHAHPDFMASVLLDKYNWHVPEYRQAQMLRSEGLQLPTSTINDWVHACGDHLYPLYMIQRKAVLEGGYVQVDEVPSNIADRKGAVRKGYNWQVLDVSPNTAGTYFHYSAGSRGGDVPKGLLKDFEGVVQTDGYGGYEFLEARPEVTMLACLAHIRRKFVDAEKEDPLATYFLDYISKLYDLEYSLQARGATCEEILKERQRLAVPILDHLDKWMEAVQVKVTPSSLMGKAMSYAYKRWPRIRRYAEDGRYRIDNNPVERGNRKPVLGRKNYLFSQNDEGAEDNAIFYTFIESCEIVGVDPRKWLEAVLAQPLAEMDKAQLTELLPANYKKEVTQ